MLAEQLSAIADEDPEEKRKDKERKDAAAAKARAAAGGAPDSAGPKSKEQRDRERREAREAKAAKDAAELAGKEAKDRAEREVREAETAAAVAAKKASEDAQLLRESELARAAISARGRPLGELALLLVDRAESPLEACGGLLALCVDWAPEALLPPLVGAVIQRMPAGGAPTETATSETAVSETGVAAAAACEAAAAAVARWAVPMGWLVCRCADVRQAQLELLRAVVDGLAGQGLLAHASPLLKALWQHDLVEEGLLLEWSGTLRPAVRRCVEPLAEWLKATPVVDE
eukprot:scaffold33710_cov79-Isochrysis_galbana.AAC.1